MELVYNGPKERVYFTQKIETASSFAVEFGGIIRPDGDGFLVILLAGVNFSEYEKGKMYEFLKLQFS